MAQPKIAAFAPVACAACYGQYPDRVHVDYAAGIEGAEVDPSVPRGPHVEWVVMCEDCVRAGYQMLPEQSGRIDHLTDEVEQLRQRAEEAENYASKLEDTLHQRPVQREVKLNVEKVTPKKTPARPRKTRYATKDA